MSHQPIHETNPLLPTSRPRQSRVLLVFQMVFSLLLTAIGAYGLYAPPFPLGIKFWTAVLICGGAISIWAAYELLSKRPPPE